MAEVAASSSSPPPQFAERWARGCRTYRYGIMVMWMVVAVLGFCYGLRFLDETVSDFPSPKGSPSYAASLELVSNFPHLQDTTAETLLLKSSDGVTSVVEGDLADALAEVYTHYTTALTDKYPDVIKGPVLAYYPLKDLMPALAGPLVSTDKTATIFIISYDASGSDQDRSAFIAYLTSEARALLLTKGLGDDKVTIGLTGLGSFGEDIVDGVKRDAATMDSIVLPVALLILAMVVHSLPLMILPILTIPVTLLAQFLVMYPISLKIAVVSFAPSLMMSLTIAMGIDYTLFLCTRYMDAIRAQMDLLPAITLMLQSAGYIIVVSGSTLCVSFLGLLFLPMEILRSLGLGASIAIIMALAVNLTLVPALLFSLGPSLQRADRYINATLLLVITTALPGGGLFRRRRREEKAAEEPLLEPDGGAINAEEDGGGDDDDDAQGRRDSYVHVLDEEEHFDKSCWLGLAKVVVRPWWGVVIFAVVLALAIPVMLQVLAMKPSVEFDLMLPYDSSSYTTLQSMSNGFGGAGVAFPYRLLMVLTPTDGTATTTTTTTTITTTATSVLSREAYDAMTYTVQQLVDRVSGTRLSDFTGIMALGGSIVTYDDMLAALNTTQFDPYYFTLKTLASQLVSSNEQATYASVTLTLDPYSPIGQDWLVSAREVLSSLQGQTGLSLYLEGGGGTIHDAVGSVLEVLTISITLAFVYGLTVVVYQGGALDGLGARAVSGVGAIAWLPIVICFSIIIGLGLDYDVFLVSRVLEERLDGHTDQSALVRGMVSTGHIITAAGIIMAVAFSGLLFSTEIVLNQTAFLLVASVLLDTFIVRTFLVPILMTWTGKYTWWPRKDLPPPTQDYHLF